MYFTVRVVKECLVVGQINICSENERTNLTTYFGNIGKVFEDSSVECEK